MSVHEEQTSGSGQPRQVGLSRRHALGGALGLGVAAPLLTACGGDSGSQDAAPTGSGPVVGTADVPVGSAVIVAERNLVVSQPQAGEFQVFSSICPHQKCPVTKVAGSTVDCPCHGSRFSITDGSVQQGPAEEGLAPVEFTVEGEEIVVG